MDLPISCSPTQSTVLNDGASSEIYLASGYGGGKALALDTPIPTPTGWTTMGELRDGDVVFDEAGNHCRVVTAHPVLLGRDCYEVEFSDGTVVVADGEHLWQTMDLRARKAAYRARKPRCGPEVRTTEQIRDTLRNRHGQANHAVATAMPINMPAADLLVPPYVLGAWLGDGTSRFGSITVGGDDAVELLGMCAKDGLPANGKPNRKPGTDCITIRLGVVPPTRDPVTGRLRSAGGFESQLRSLGVLNNKHIPMRYLRASVDQREALLAGLMDTDGTADPDGGVEFSVVNERLAREVHELVLSLGYKATVKSGPAMLNGRRTGTRYRIKWTPDRPVFRLKRKMATQTVSVARSPVTRNRYIVDVRPVPSVPVRCITVDSPSRLYLCSRAFIPTHNTFAGVWFAISRSLANPPLVLGMCAEPTFPMVSTVMVPEFRKAFDRLNVSPQYNKNEKVFTWGPEQRAFFLRSAERPENLAGPTLGWVWLDEAAQMDEEAFRRSASRVRDETATLRQFLCTSTHEGSRTWFNARANCGEPGVRLVQGRTQDNRHNGPEYLARLESMFRNDPQRRQMYIEGLAVELRGGIYSSLGPENIVPCRDTRGSWVVGFDFNLRGKCSPIGTRRGGELHIWGEVVTEHRCGTDEHVARVVEYLRKRGAQKHGRDGELTDFSGQQIEAYIDASGDTARASSTQTDKWHVRQAGLFPKHPSANPYVRDRIAAVNYALREKTLLIDPDGAPMTLRALREHAYDRDEKPQKQWGENEFPLDNATDALGYIVWGVGAVRNVGSLVHPSSSAGWTAPKGIRI